MNTSRSYRQYFPNLKLDSMAALYDLFRTPQPKGEKKVRYHARSVVTGKITTRDLIKIQGRDIDTSRPSSGTFLFPCS